MALTDNLVSYWKLDETSGTRADSHGSNSLTDNNTVTYATGKINNSASFDDANSEYLSIADASQSGLDFTSDFSVSCWVKPKQTPNGGGNPDIGIFYKWGASQAAYGMYYGYIGGAPKIRFNGYTSGGGSNYSFDWTVTLSTSSYSHIAFRYTQSTTKCELWINGSSQGEVLNASYTGSSNTTGAFSISSLGSGVQWYWDGEIDEFGIWNRVLTGAEVTSLYNSGSGLTYPFSTTSIKTINGLALASVKTLNGLAIASVKTLNGLA